MENKIYKCIYCSNKYGDKKPLYQHMESEHHKLLRGLPPAQLLFNIRNKKSGGKCVMCGKPTEWNDKSEKYQRYCSKTCIKKYSEIMKARMVNKYGKEHLLDDADIQKDMLSSRKISGEYKWSDDKTITSYTGSYELKFLEYLDLQLNWKPSDVISPAPQIFEYQYEKKTHFYIPDFYIESLNLIVEIKDGGDNPNTHPEIISVNKVKDELKKEAVINSKMHDYIKIEDNQFDNFMRYLTKKGLIDKNVPKGYHVNDNELKTKSELIYNENTNFELLKEASYISYTFDEKSELKRVFIILTYRGGIVANAISWFTNTPYSHVGISFNEKLDNIYSYNKDGFTIEDVNNKDMYNDEAKYSVYYIDVPNDVYNTLKKNIPKFKNTLFNYIGAILNNVIGTNFTFNDRLFCSEFVSKLFEMANMKLFNTASNKTIPYDFAKHPNVIFKERGKFKSLRNKIKG